MYDGVGRAPVQKVHPGGNLVQDEEDVAPAQCLVAPQQHVTKGTKGRKLRYHTHAGSKGDPQ